MPDDYTKRARLAPAALAAIPAAVLILGGIGTPDQAESIISFAFGALGFLVAGFTRERGSRLQPELWRAWDGRPTVRRLRWRETEDQAVMARRHARIEAATGETLPTADEEDENPTDADNRYSEVISELRWRTRDRQTYAPLFDENAEYGFRRNCLGIRPLALGIAVAVLVVSLVLLVISEDDTWFLFSAAAGAAALPAWWFIVKPNWVRVAAERYADRLIEAGEAMDPQSAST